MPIIRCFFCALGRFIASWPTCFGAISLLLGILLCAGVVKIQLKDNIRDGFTPDNAPSKAEKAAIRAFWNASGDPMKAMVLIRSKLPDRNMLRLDLLTETVQLSQFLQREFSIPAISDGQQPASSANAMNITYADLCGSYCEFAAGFELFVDGLSQTIRENSSSNKLADEHRKVEDERDGTAAEKEGNEEKEGAASGHRHNLTYPLATVHSMKVHLEWIFFGVKLRTPDGNGTVSRSPEQLVTNMESVELVLLTFYADRSTPLKAQRLTSWEIALYEYLQEQYKSDFLDVQVIGVEILDKEMIRDNRDNIKYFSLGIIAMSVFVGVNVFGMARARNQLDAGKALIAMATVGCPLLAIGSTYGALSILGLRVNSFLLILPYLILGIGVDDGFLLMHQWFRLAHDVRHPIERMALVFAEVGPSVTVTTLTNVISFAVGAATPTLEIRLFCFGTALALTLDYVLQLSLFCPIMFFSTRFEQIDNGGITKSEEEGERGNGKKGDNMPSAQMGLAEPTKGMRKYTPTTVERQSGKAEKVRVGKIQKMLRAYCALLANKWFAVLVLSTVGVYLFYAIRGMERIQSKLDLDKLLPRDSQMRQTSQLLNEKVWTNYLPVTIVVDGPLNVSFPQQMDQFWTMVEEIEGLPHCKGSELSLVWLRDYQRFFFDEDDSVGQLYNLMGELQMDDLEKVRWENELGKEKQAQQLRREKEKQRQEEGQGRQMDLCRLEEFLDLPFYIHWATLLHHTSKRRGQQHCPTVSSFLLMFAFHDIQDWDVRIQLMQRLRAIAANHSAALNMSISVWEENSLFVDQILSLRPVTIQSGLLTLACMAVVCALFVPNLVSVLLACASICSISVGVFGFLAWFGFDLDPVTMAATLMSIGLSVDFTAHVICHFQQDRHKFRRDHTSPLGFSEQLVPLATAEDKLRHTLKSVGLPMLQSGISTALCILALSFIRKYAPTVFVHAVFLVCGWGLLHGLLVLPCVLCLLPNWCREGRIRPMQFIRSMCAPSGGFYVHDENEKRGEMSGEVKNAPEEGVEVGRSEEKEAEEEEEMKQMPMLNGHGELASHGAEGADLFSDNDEFKSNYMLMSALLEGEQQEQ